MIMPPQFEIGSELSDGSTRLTVSNELDGRETTLPATLELELKRDLQAPSVARAAASGRCDGLALSASLCHTLMLLVSEVVSNAVLHSNAATDTPIVLTTSITDDAIFVTVTDTGDGFTPVHRKPDATRGGYGLYLVDKAARRWGVDRVGGTRVWFELPRTTQHSYRDIEEGTSR